MHKSVFSRIIRKLLKIICAIILSVLLATCAFILIGILVSQKLEVRQYTIQSEELTNPLRIAHITDLHNAQIGKKNRKLIDAITEVKPDAIFMTGDMINRDDPDLTVITDLIVALKDVAPVYYGYGNHEVTWEENFGDTLENELKKSGAIVLQDSYVDVELNGNMIRIGGCMNYYRAWHMLDHTDELIQTEADFADNFEATTYTKFLLNHIPTAWVDWKYINSYPVDYVFSGHYHGGMIRIPVLDKGLYAPYVGLFPEYTRGITAGSQATCIQSAGLGTEHNIPRIFNPPEVVIVNFTKK